MKKAYIITISALILMTGIWLWIGFNGAVQIAIDELIQEVTG